MFSLWIIETILLQSSEIISLGTDIWVMACPGFNMCEKLLSFYHKSLAEYSSKIAHSLNVIKGLSFLIFGKSPQKQGFKKYYPLLGWHDWVEAELGRNNKLIQSKVN